MNIKFMVSFLSKVVIGVALFFLGFYSGQQFESKKQQVDHVSIVKEFNKKDLINQSEPLLNLEPVAIKPIATQEKLVTRKAELPQKQTTINLVIDFGGNKIKNFNNIVITDKTTVFDVLKKITAENNLEFKYSESGSLGSFIESIDGSANNFKENKFWQYWVNSKYALVGASSYVLHDGDVVEWRYIKREF